MAKNAVHKLTAVIVRRVLQLKYSKILAQNFIQDLFLELNEKHQIATGSAIKKKN